MFTNLEELNLSNNNITEITPISNLENLILLDLSDNSNINIYNKQTEECYLPNKMNLQELNISKTNNSDISFVNQLTNLKVFKASDNGIGSTSQLKFLNNIEVLILSNNTPIKAIDDILELSTLKELDISSTGITSLLHSKSTPMDEYPYGIHILENLEILKVGDNALESIDPILYSYLDTMVVLGKEVKYPRAYLENLKQLNFNYTGQSKIDYDSLILLKNLTHLSMRGNNISKLDEEITELKKLEYIDLSENLLTDINKFVKYITVEEKRTDENGNTYTEKVQVPQYLTATTINIAYNKIIDVSLLSGFDHDIEELDLSKNAIYDIEFLEDKKFKKVNLKEQGCGWKERGWSEPVYSMPIKDKEVSVDQYIILPSLFQNSKKSGSKLYSENANFTVTNIKLNENEDYQVPGYYNVIIDYQKTKNDELKITLHGGIADGSTLYFKISTSQTSIDSSIFNDPNLISAISEEINEMGYGAKNALKIINVYSYVFEEIDTLRLEGFKIKDIMGLASFDNLAYLYLSNNDISSINELRENKIMKELYLSNNPNLKDITAIENMVSLTKLDLANVGLTNINSVNNLIANMYKKNKNSYPIKYLNLSSNSIDGIEGIEVLKSLEELYISNINIKDISKISTLTNLRKLNVSGNRIEDLESLRGLNNLKFLYVNNNNIENIEPISKIALSTLEFSGNRVKDVTSLTQSYSSLIMDSNLISDISCFNNVNFENFSIANQKLTHTVEQGETGDITIELPPLMLLAKQPGSKVYTEKDYILTNCELTEDKKAVIVNVESLKSQIAIVQINKGNAHNTKFSIAEPLEGTIEYTPSNEIPTNQDITAKITFNRENVTITNNDGKDIYLFTENGEFTFEYIDINGFEGVTTATVTNIDKAAPIGTVTQEIVNKQVVVKINLNEPIAAIEGWNTSEDGLNITKTYAVDANETITLTDNVGNVSSVQVIVEIDTTAPIITGVENGKLYGQAVTPVIEDKNLDTVKLTKNDIEVVDYTSGTPIIESGKYVLTVRDKFENETTLTFDIDVSGVIISLSNQMTVTENEIVGEETKSIIRIMTPKTTIAQIKENLKSEMSYKILNTKGNVVTSLNTKQVGTGYQIKMQSEKIYTIIVYGDITGDGEISISELALASRLASNPEMTIDNLQFLAIDVSKDGKITVPDLAALSRLKNTY